MARYLPPGVVPGSGYIHFGPVGVSPNANGAYPWTRPVAPVPMAAPQATPKFNLSQLFGGPMQGNPSASPQMFQTTRSSAVQSQLTPAFANNAASTSAGQQSVADYAKQILSGQPQAQEFANQETNSVNQIYDPNGIQAQLDHLNRQEQAAQNIAAQNAASGVRRNINAQRVGGGSSSYLDRLLAQQLYTNAAGVAGRGAQQGRADLTWLTGQRNGAIGQRTNILNTLAQRGLMPTLAGQQIQSGALDNLSRLANLDYGNNIYEHPEDAYRRQLDLLNYLSPYSNAY